MTQLAKSALLLSIFSLALASASAQTLSGTVTNGTTGKPAVGDEVILINLTTSMEIAANTKADSNGKFSFKLSGPAGPHLIRAVHQGVTYHQMAPPGVNTADVQVYDVAPKIAGLGVTADVIRFQADSGTMQGVRLFVVNNASSPAKTQMNDHNFEFYLPAGAKVEQVQARAPNGQPISAEAVPQAEKNRYAINFPLRPGETQFQLEFTLPYSGEIKIDPKLLYPAQHFVVVLPQTMQFKAENPPSFDAMHDPSQGDSNVEVAKETKPGEVLAFTLKGQGVITDSPGDNASGAAQQPDQQQAQQQQSEQSQQVQTSGNRPGGGLGIPIDAPDPLQKYRWPILGGFAMLLAIGGWVVTKRQPVTAASSSAVTSSSAAKPVAAASDYSAVLRPTEATPATTTPIAPAAKSSMLLEALKEELFQLEVEKKQGKITPEDYEKARAALDQTLDRALKRQQG
ncbi:MAG: carboxypeptidase-like regulatory domain-containing protein [Terriglobales bacterium]